MNETKKQLRIGMANAGWDKTNIDYMIEAIEESEDCKITSASVDKFGVRVKLDDGRILTMGEIL